MPTEQILRVENLSKTFGSKTALAEVSFTLETGEVIGLLGPNGWRPDDGGWDHPGGSSRWNLAAAFV